MSIVRRLYLGFALLLGLMLAITAIGVVKVGVVDQTLQQINDVDSRKQRFAINFRGSVHDRAISIRDAVLSRDLAERETHLRDITALDRFYQTSAQSMDSLFARTVGVTEREVQLLRAIKEIETQALSLTERLLRLLEQERHQQAHTLLLSEVAPAYSEWLTRINAFIDYQETAIQQEVDSVRSETGGFLRFMLGVTLVSVVIGLAIAFHIIQRLQSIIGGEAETAVALIKRFSQGDLDVHYSTRYPDSILGAVNVMAERLGQSMQAITHNALQLNQAAQQMQQHAVDNSHLIDVQKRETYQGANAMAQMSDAVNDVARLTHQAAELASSANAETLAGHEEVVKTITTINALAAQVEDAAAVIQKLARDSNEIGAVVEVIAGIAEQTNLLALNAAIEAARAGDQGRGFAVVADEVRSLAGRTKESTVNIQTLIHKTQDQVARAVDVMEHGLKQTAASVEQAQHAGESLVKIREAVSAINDMNTQIAGASEEQSAVAQEVNQNFREITTQAERVSAGSAQIGATTDDLVRMANSLRQAVAYFRH